MRRGIAVLADFGSLMRVMRLIRMRRPYASIAMTPKASLLVMVASFLARTPYRLYATGGLRLEGSEGAQRLVLWLMEKVTCVAANDVVANSRSLAAAYRASRLAVEPKLRTVMEGSSHGVDTEYFFPATQAQRTDGPLQIGFVGRLTRDKGIPTLLEACVLLAERGAEFELHVVGPQDEPDSAAFLGLMRSQSFVVHVRPPMDDVRPALRNMDVLVLPSLREGFPNVVLEAAAMGIPSVVSDATGCIDSVIDQVTGLVVPVQDPKALAEALCSLSDDRARVRALGMEARRRAVTDFRPRDVVQGVLKHAIADRPVGM